MADTKRFQIFHKMHVNDSVNGHWTAALGTVESKEPALAASNAVNDAESTRVEDAQGGIVLLLVKEAFL